VKEIEAAVRALFVTVPRTLLDGEGDQQPNRSAVLQIESWLQEHALPAVSALWNHISLRRAATAPQAMFGSDRSTPGWQQVDQLAKAIREAASAAASLGLAAAKRTQFPTLSTAREQSRPGEGELRIVESVIITAGKPPVQTKYGPTADPATQVVHDLLHVQKAKKRRPGDLVSIEDYFGPRQDAFVRFGDKRLPAGMFLSLVNPRIRQAGNFVIRCLLARVATDSQAIGRLVEAAASHLPNPASSLARERAEKASSALRQQIEQAENLFVRSPEAICQDACIALVHFAVEWTGGEVETSWLQLPDRVIRERHLNLRYELSRTDNCRALVQLVKALEDAGHLYANMGPEDEKVERAIASGGLVFDGEAIYWDSELISEDLSREMLRLLRLLAQKCRCQQAVNENDLDPKYRGMARSNMHMRIGRLKHALPSSLSDRIVPNRRQPRTYMLNLPATSVLFFNQVPDASASTP